MARGKLKHIRTRIKEGALKELLLQARFIYGYARHYKLAIVFYTIIGMVSSVVGIGTSLISKDLIDIITGHKTGELLNYFAAMIGFALGSVLLNQLSNYFSNLISLRVDSEIKADIFTKILATELESINEFHTGDLLTRWESDSSNISGGILNWLPTLFVSSFRFLAAFAVVIYYDWTFAVFSFIGVPVTLIMSKVLMRRMVNNNKKSASMSAKMNGFNQESFSNIQTIKAFDLIKLYTKHLKDLQHEFITMKMDFQKLSIISSILMATIGLVISYSSYGWGIYRVWSGVITYGTMTMFLSMSGTLTGTLNSLISLVPNGINLGTSAGRLMEILDMPKEDYSMDDTIAKFSKKNKSHGISVFVDQIKYGYKDGDIVFDNASLEAHPHECIALVGESGGGKTTMLRLILALLHPSEGEISLIGANNDSVPVTASARKLFSYVPQGNTMFSGTIASNMRDVKPDATDEEIIAALKMACAWSFVKKLPDQINASIKERGGGFSEGQAQRLSIARALIRKSPILLLDEATSALDKKTESKLLKRILTDDYPRTIIVTTHRSSILSSCNRIYEIKKQKCKKL